MKQNKSLELSKTNTKLASQRTFLAYMRTGFGIAGIAGIFKKPYLVAFGLIMIVLSTVQYYLLLKDVESDNVNKFKVDYLHYLPMIYVVLSVSILYLQFYR